MQLREGAPVSKSWGSNGAPTHLAAIQEHILKQKLKPKYA